MSVAKLIQHLSLDNNEIQDVRLQGSPDLTGVNKIGAFGIDANGGLAYIAGYNGTNPVINSLKEYIAQASEAGQLPLLTITRNVGLKHGISVNLIALLARLIKDNDQAEDSTWSSQKIVDYIFQSQNPPRLDEDNLTLDLTGAQLEALYPDSPIGTTYFSQSQGIQYTKISDTAWKFEVLDIRTI